MDKTILVEDGRDRLIMPMEVDVEDGRKLLKALHKVDFDVSVALWLYSSDFGQWRLTLGSPVVDQEGPKSAYIIVQSELAKLKLRSRISLWDISVLGLNDEPVHAMLAHDYQGLTERWFRELVIGDTFIEAAYIYDLKNCSTDKTE